MNTPTPTAPQTTLPQTRQEHLIPDPQRPILWAATELDQKVDALRRSNWITEELIRFSQKHWHCSREQAIQRLVTAEPTNA